MQLAARLRPVLIACVVMAPLFARAEVTTEGAAQLEKGIHDWVAGLLGPQVPLPPLPVRITTEADHYRVDTDIGGPIGTTGYTIDPGSIVASIHPLDGNRWSLDGFRWPSPLRVTSRHAIGPAPISWTLKLGDQDVRGVLDTTLATASTLDVAVRDYSVVTETGEGQQTARTETYKVHSVWDPTSDGRLNMSTETALHNVVISQDRPAEEKANMTIDSLAGVARLDRVDLGKLKQIIPTTIAFGMGMDAARKGDGHTADSEGIPESLRPLARELVLTASALLGGGKEDITAEGIRVEAQGYSASLARLNFGLEAGVPEGRLTTRLHLSFDGIDSSAIPKGVFRDYLPRHFSMTPRVSGIPAADVIQLALHAIDAGDKDQDALQAEAIGLLAKGPLEVGIEELALDLGLATLKGIGALEIPSPDAIKGKAEITVTGLDALIKRASAIPQLKQGAPVLIFLKGIGEQKGDATVWRVIYENNSVTINGTDLSQMIPGK